MNALNKAQATSDGATETAPQVATETSSLDRKLSTDSSGMSYGGTPDVTTAVETMQPTTPEPLPPDVSEGRQMTDEGLADDVRDIQHREQVRLDLEAKQRFENERRAMND